MTVEEAISESGDQFPVGMRVLAVDDDPTCLMVLQTLLRRCQYQVTTTSQAISALKLLRENKNQFDLVISDVHMPDMDGFKLLELVGLEMDLPVIMLSGNGDPKLVMKGITHGACDYLLKPVRIEELKNIWQHVVRRKKKERKNPNAAESKDKSFDGNNESGGMGNADQIAKNNNKRRKDQDEEEDEERDDSDNDDPSAQKKPRVVWTVELHRKFVGAVNQLGVDKAVPKKILELMNVEKLTRENVASHLQKYRLYLKRISCVANQQANLAAALGTADPSYLQMSSLNIQNLNGFGSFHSLGGSDQFQNAAFRSLPSTGMLGRLNSPAGMGIRNLPSPGLMQLGQAKSASNVSNNPNRFQQVMIPGNYNGSVLQGMPLSLEQDNKGVNRNEPLPLAVDNSSLVGCSSSPLLGVANEPLLLEGRPHESKGGAMYGNQSSVTIASMNPGSSSHLPDLGRCSDNWSNAVMSSGVQANSFDLSDCLQPATSLTSNLADSISPVAFQNGNVSDLQGQEDASSFDVPHQWNGGYRQDAASYASNLVNNSRNSTLDGTIASFRQCLDQNNAVFPRNMNLGGSTGQQNYVDSNIQGFGTSSGNANPGYLVGQQRMQGRYIHNNIGSLEDLASIMVKQEVRPSGDFCNNPGSYRTCSS